MNKKAKYKVSIIGAGNIASRYDSPKDTKILTHAHAILDSEQFELLGFFDSNEENAYSEATKWKTSAFKSVEDACNMADVVCCCVPDKFHFGVLKFIAEFKPKLIIAEKPLTLSICEAYEVRNIYQTNSIPIALNYSRRYIKKFQEIRNSYRCNEYGKLLKGIGLYGKGISHNGGHIIDLLLFIFGDGLKVKSTENPIPDFEPLDNTYDVELEVSSGIVSLKGIDSRVCTVFELDLLFERARLRIVNGGSNIEFYRVEESKEYKNYYNYVKRKDIVIDYSDALRGLYQNVANYLDYKEPLLCTTDDGINVIRVCSDIKEKYNE